MGSEHDKYACQVFVWSGTGNPKDVGEVVAKMHSRIKELEATERELREAVKVLASMVHEWELACGLSDAWQKGRLILSRMSKGTRMSNGFDDAVRERMRNQIAAAAVMEAGR